MANIDISVEIDHLNYICRTGNLTAAIFSFNYQNQKYKCFYCSGGDVITIAPENYNIGLNLSIKDYKINNYFKEEDNYKKLKQIHPVGLSTGIFCNRMIEVIARTTLDTIQPVTNAYITQICRKVVKNCEEEKICFYSWRRHLKKGKAGEDNLFKTRLFFGEEIYNICKTNKISSCWKEVPTKKSLDFLNRNKSKEELLNL